MPLYEVVLEQNYANQQCINMWNFQSGTVPSGVSGAFKLAVAMGAAPDTDIEPFGEDTILGKLRAFQHISTAFVQLVVRNLYSVTDFYTYAFPPNTNGTNSSSDGESPTIAFGFTSDRTRSDIRRAQKRFTGVVEGAVQSLGIIVPSVLDQLQELGDTMADVNVVPAGAGTITYTPYVFGREFYVVPSSGKDAYRYYETEAEQLDHIAQITAWTPKPQVRTQTSRQYGRGS